jgi:ABC-type transport system involved in multi-copper enzyme maturation permease subunit
MKTMSLPPVVERELRSTSRQRGFFWLRAVVAVVMCLKGYDLLDRFVVSPAGARAGPGPITGSTFLHELCWLLFLAALLLGLYGADAINRERREGTLGLLLITGLKPGEVVFGKLLSCGLMSFLALLGFMPGIMLAVLAGGVSGTEAVLSGLGLLIALFVSLSAGLWMSAVFRGRRQAILATLALVGAVAFAGPVIGGGMLGSGAVPGLRLLGLSGWLSLAPAPASAPFWVHVPMFFVWLGMMGALGWLFLYLAGNRLAKNWQVEMHKHFREPEIIAQYLTIAPAATPFSWLTEPRAWDEDPVHWRVEQLGSPAGLVWLALGIDFLAQLGVLGAALGGQGANVWGIGSFFGLTAIAFASGLLAWAGGRFFHLSRSSGDLELLQTTPVAGRNIIKGQWRELRKVLKAPLLLLLALALPAAFAVMFGWSGGGPGANWFFLHPLLILLNLAVEMVTLCWVGMWFGLTARHALGAVSWTVALVVVGPLILVIGIVGLWTWMAQGIAILPADYASIPGVIPALLFSIGKNIALIFWARHRLRRELRLQSGWAWPNLPMPTRVVLRPQ